MEKVIFVYPKKATFIQLDIDILSEKYTVVENTYQCNKKIKVPWFLIKQFFFLLKNIKSTSCIIVSFGGYWSVLPSLIGRLFNKPTLIILNGADCASFKELNYGGIRKPILKRALGISYKYASRLLPVSKSLIYTENTYFKKGTIVKQGVDYYFPKTKTDKTIIANAIDSNKWVINSQQRISNRFVTVLGAGQFKLKGGELIIAVARKLPQFEFCFAGIEDPEYIGEIPGNVSFVGRLKPEELLEFYNSSKYYLQLSIYEGFGVALCEAMLCGCIPIVSSVNALPDIVDSSGFILNEMDENLLESLILNLDFENKSELGGLARKRIVDNYSIKQRKEALFAVIEKEKITFSKS